MKNYMDRYKLINNIENILDQLDINQLELSEMTGIPKSTISDIIREEHMPNGLAVVLLQEFLQDELSKMPRVNALSNMLRVAEPPISNYKLHNNNSPGKVFEIRERTTRDLEKIKITRSI